MRPKYFSNDGERKNNMGQLGSLLPSDYNIYFFFQVYLLYNTLTFISVCDKVLLEQTQGVRLRPGDCGPMFPAQSRVWTIRSPGWQVGFQLVNYAGKSGQAGAGWCSTTPPPHWRRDLFGCYRPGSGGHVWSTGRSQVPWMGQTLRP